MAIVVEVRKRGERTRGESLEARQARLAQQGQKGSDHAALVTRTFGPQHIEERPKKRSFRDMHISHHTLTLP